MAPLGNSLAGCKKTKVAVRVDAQDVYNSISTFELKVVITVYWVLFHVDSLCTSMACMLLSIAVYHKNFNYSAKKNRAWRSH